MRHPRISIRVDRVSEPFDAGTKSEIEMTIHIQHEDIETTTKLRRIVPAEMAAGFHFGDTYDALFVKR